MKLFRIARAVVFCSLACGTAYAQKPAALPSGTHHKISNPINDLLDQAQRAIERQEFEAAIAPLQKVAEEEPSFAYAHFQLGYVFTALKRWDDARREYQRAVELDPNLAEGYVNLAMVLLPRDPAAAVAPLRKAVELLPAQSRPRYLLGLALDQTGDLAGAVTALQEAERLDPRDAETRLALADLLLRSKQPAEAQKKFQEVLALNPGSFPARLGLAHALDAQQKPAAVEAYRAFLEGKPDDRASRARLSHLLFEQKQYDAALAELDRLDAAGPDPSSLRLRADIQVAQSRWDEAIATLRRAIAIAPAETDLRSGLGRIYLERRDFPAAEKELLEALRLAPGDLAAIKDLSSAYYLEGNCPAALAVMDAIAKRETPGPGTWFVRATCYDKMKNVPEAIAAYEKFLAGDAGKNPNQEWQADQRLKVLRRMQEKKR